MFLSQLPFGRSRALVALLLSVPFTSIGAIALLFAAPGLVGQGVLVLCQLWLLLFPLIWQRQVKREPFNVSLPKCSDWIVGLVVGLLMFCIILAAYGLFLKDWIIPSDVQQGLEKIGGVQQQAFWIGGAYFIFVNALIEEYFWRWFVFSRCEEWMPGRRAIVLSALFFTLHHTIGLSAFVSWPVVAVVSLAVFVAGVVWSVYYRWYRSIWGNYISHAIADIALHIVAWQVFFG